MIQSSIKTHIFSIIFVLSIFSSYQTIGQAVDAGDDQTVCTDVTTLNAKDPGGFGEWSVKAGFGKGVFVNPADPDTDVREIGFGTNTYVWTYWKNGTESSDEVVITNWSSYAGSTSTTCSDEAQLNSGDPSLIPGGLAWGKWTTTSPGVTYDDDSQYNTMVYGLSPGNNIFRWTVTDESLAIADPCRVTWSEVIVTYNVGGPNTYVVSGTGAICTGGTAIVSVSGSDNGVTYKLLHDALPLDGTFDEIGNDIIGDGNALQFTAYAAGEYRVKAETDPTCFAIFPNTISITENSLTNYSLGVIGNDYYCSGDSIVRT